MDFIIWNVVAFEPVNDDRQRVGVDAADRIPVRCHAAGGVDDDGEAILRVFAQAGGNRMVRLFAGVGHSWVVPGQRAVQIEYKPFHNAAA